MRKFALAVRSFLAAEDGPTAVEYVVMMMLIILVCFAGIMAVGNHTANIFQNAANSVH